MKKNEVQRDNAINDFIWNIVELNSCLEAIHKTWAELLGISEAQWLILMAVEKLDKGAGVSGVDISAKLRVHPAFVTNQTKSLEQSGLLARIQSQTDARFIQMFLTPAARTEIAKLSEKKEKLNTSIFSTLDTNIITDLNFKLNAIRKNSERAARHLAADIADT